MKLWGVLAFGAFAAFMFFLGWAFTASTIKLSETPAPSGSFSLYTPVSTPSPLPTP